MSKITKVELTNFRNIKHIVLDLKKNPSVISGDNNLGKSNILSALSWFFANCLLTDKWGTGENDIDSIIPIDQVKGEHVSVKVTFDSGVEFTKMYKTLWDLKSGKPKGHTAEGYINSSASKNMTLWNAELVREVGFVETIHEINELRLFTDPLYALQKIDAKQLRRLLILLGCDVSNEEVYEALNGEYDLSIVRSQESKYRGNFYEMRTDYKRKLLADTDSIGTIDKQLLIYNDAKDYDKEKLEAIDVQLTALRNDYYSLKDESTQKMVDELDLKISALESQRQIKLQEFRSKRDIQITNLSNQLDAKRKEYKKASEDRIKDLKDTFEKAKDKEYLLTNQKNAYGWSLETIVKSLESASESGKRLIQQQKDYIIKLNEVKDSTFNDKITCPYCFSQFVADPSKEAIFEANKQNDIAKYNSLIEKCQEDINKQKVAFVELKNQRDQTKTEISKLQSELDELANTIAETHATILQKMAEPLDKTEIEDLERRITKITLSDESVEVKDIDSQIESLKKEKNTLSQNASSLISEKREEINDKIQGLDLEKTELNIAKSRWETKQDLLAKREEAIARRNNHEAELEVINAVIHKTIEMCNQKAYEKTGFKFVMLEETLSETIKEVCYLTVDGVPFAQINTSRKMVYGTMFINKIKEILNEDMGVPINDLPVLCDKLETLSLKTLESFADVFSKCQCICTKVTNGEEIEVC